MITISERDAARQVPDILFNFILYVNSDVFLLRQQVPNCLTSLVTENRSIIAGIQFKIEKTGCQISAPSFISLQTGIYAEQSQ